LAVLLVGWVTLLVGLWAACWAVLKVGWWVAALVAAKVGSWVVVWAGPWAAL